MYLFVLGAGDTVVDQKKKKKKRQGLYLKFQYYTRFQVSPKIWRRLLNISLKHTEQRRRQCDHRSRDWSDAPHTPRNVWGHQKLEEARMDSPLKPLEKV